MSDFETTAKIVKTIITTKIRAIRAVLELSTNKVYYLYYKDLISNESALCSEKTLVGATGAGQRNFLARKFRVFTGI